MKHNDPSTSPDLLAKPNGFEGVMRLNRKPLMLLGVVAVIVLVAIVYSMQRRGLNPLTSQEEAETAYAANRLADQIVADQPLGLIGAPPAPAPPSAQVEATGSESEVQVDPMGELDAPSPIFPSAPPAPPSQLEQQLRQRHLQLIWERHDRLLQSIRAETQIDFDTASTSGVTAPHPGHPRRGIPQLHGNAP
ncbi:MAG: hypothetical protein ETSY1_09135 [Candidatus Entotheonella factor]|uniref:Uncharacterized protein n=1 Tax=Entotheonella factor TaxID=1429438 RepID=W4LSQ4_ENTF1|nr:MAG: hypothetical protein ETSY1_09135 [Candidatus Entotheonella factor]